MSMLVGNYGVIGGCLQPIVTQQPLISLVFESWVIEVPESFPKPPLVIDQIPHLELYAGL
jgi:hypothetical protein